MVHVRLLMQAMHIALQDVPTQYPHTLLACPCMQVEGLALAVGGKAALQGMLRSRNPVLAAHGPYTAAGALKCIRTRLGLGLVSL